MIHIEVYNTFFKSYKEKLLKLESKHIDVDKSRYNSLLNSFQTFNQLIGKIEEIEAREFNLFEIIGICHLEERVHTPVLANLLNPQGSHAQGALFYNAFMNVVLKEFNISYKFKCSDYNYLEITSEKTAGIHGEIDILIYNSHPNERFAIIIENKIWAQDQKKQLDRYYYYAQKYLSLPSDRILLIYLTPFGNEVSQHSLSAKLTKTLIESQSLCYISYKDHIINWLEVTLPIIKSDKVKHTLKQYLQTINTICND